MTRINTMGVVTTYDDDGGYDNSGGVVAWDEDEGGGGDGGGDGGGGGGGDATVVVPEFRPSNEVEAAKALDAVLTEAQIAATAEAGPLTLIPRPLSST